jgi:hypothetical protein
MSCAHYQAYCLYCLPGFNKACAHTRMLTRIAILYLQLSRTQAALAVAQKAAAAVEESLKV